MRTRRCDTIQAPKAGCIGGHVLPPPRDSTGLGPGNSLASSEAGGASRAAARGSPRSAEHLVVRGAGGRRWRRVVGRGKTDGPHGGGVGRRCKERLKEETVPWRDKAGVAAAAGREMIQEGGEATREGVRRATASRRRSRWAANSSGKVRRLRGTAPTSQGRPRGLPGNKRTIVDSKHSPPQTSPASTARPPECRAREIHHRGNEPW